VTRSELVAKYDVPLPRYTSYPTVPEWHDVPTPEEWIASLRRAADTSGAAVAVYVHLPFCESLCSFCGCNSVITRDHSRESRYVDDVLKELDTYASFAPELSTQPFEQLHLGGGTPTFLSERALAALVDGISARLGPRGPGFDASVEVDPRVTSAGQLKVLADRGFTRISLGVQDFAPEVQFLVNRIQPLEQTQDLADEARRLGFVSVNFDLIYGLPGQTLGTMRDLVAGVLRMAPDRLAVYSFARVPWIKPAQRRFRDDQIPAGADKRRLYEAVRDPLVAAGYVEIGLDHLALPHDALAGAARSGRLHRNFMGYTETRTTTLLGLGVSAISETPDCYHQNEKVLTSYEQRVRAGELATLRGHRLSDDDLRRRERIGRLLTEFAVDLEAGAFVTNRAALDTLLADGIVTIDGDRLIVPAEGRAFLRNAAAIFDAYLARARGEGARYSTSA
jgi:oxygen-independent coproporphyrinogen-3 oxidase